jgi:hypothetical protein
MMEIYHTTNYGQDWTLYEHFIPWNGIISRQSNLPSNMHLQVWPNPANASFNVVYELIRAQDIDLALFNLLGQKVWIIRSGFQLSGNYRLTLANESLPSGTYVIQLQSKESKSTKKITILK